MPYTPDELEAEEAEWTASKQVKDHYLNAVVSPGRIQFSLADRYKLDVRTKFERGILLIERVWTVAMGKKRPAMPKTKS